MELYSLILLLGVISPDWKAVGEFTHGNHLLNIDNGTLERVEATVDSSIINLSGLKIQKVLGHVFKDLTGAKTLDLSHNELEELPSRIFSRLTNLEILSVADNKIRRLTKSFIGLNKLKQLNISNNPLRFLRKGDFYGLTTSTNILVEGNDLNSLATNVFADPSIPDLESHVGFNTGRADIPRHYEERPEIPALPEGIEIKLCKTNDGLVTSVDTLNENEELGNCSKAVLIHKRRILDFSGLGITKFQFGWYKLGGFFFNGIDLSHNNITEITIELLNDLPPGLNYVNLRYNKIRMIKKNVISNPRLDTLILANNIITIIEDGAFENTELSALLLQDNQLRSLKFALTLPSTLEQLVVSDNKISEIPDSLNHLNNIRNFDISRNNLTHLSANVFRGLEELYSIKLSNNQLTRIEPGTFNDQKKVFSLQLDNNLISELNLGSFQGLTEVKFIHLQHNKLKKITRESFADLKDKYGYLIYLSHNEIDTIGEGSFDDVAVYDLDLSNNKLSEKSIAKGAFNTSTLHRLLLDNNQFTTINGDAFYGLPQLYHLSFADNRIRSINKGAAKYLRSLLDLHLSKNPIERLENGALYGLLKADGIRVHLDDVPIKVIQGGLFDDV